MTDNRPGIFDHIAAYLHGKPQEGSVAATAPLPAASTAPGAPAQWMGELCVEGASWLRTPRLTLRPGLVAIIGARGSGKTALAEMIAAGADALPATVNPRSFLHRARAYLKEAAVTLNWSDGGMATRALGMPDDAGARAQEAPLGPPRARYLSQQFVEELCSSDGMTSGLLRELERIVYESHGASEREGAVDFTELLTHRAARPREARARAERDLGVLSEGIAVEVQKRAQVPGLRAQLAAKEALLTRLAAERSLLAGDGGQERIARLTALSRAAERVRSFVRFFTLQEQQLLALKDEVAGFREREAPEALRALARRFAGSGIKGEAWAPFRLEYAGSVDRVLADQIARAQRSSASWRGRPPLPAGPDVALIHPSMDLEKVPLAVLEAEISRLSERVSLDRDTAERFAALSRRVETESELIAQLRMRLEEAESAAERLTRLDAEWESALRRQFEAVATEQAALGSLYAPIAARVAGAEGGLGKLSFAVKRSVDSDRWLAAGEALLDLRRAGPLAAPRALAHAGAALRQAWENGDAAMAATAVADFRARHWDSLLAHAPWPDPSSGEYRAWMQRLIAWLGDAGHIALRTTVAYDGADIRHLSPGSRGILLLLLYLGFDQDDDRPLIIDQPEENLDPKSVYDELVGLFVRAKARRQVILVTHNANLVVNTGADQIIVAAIGASPGEGLPQITWRAGTLSDAETRASVCDILEGGAEAFRERARRLGLDLALPLFLQEDGEASRREGAARTA